jgi:hypothetical protein
MEANCQHKKFLATITASQSRGRADARAAGATLQWFGTPEKCAEWVDRIANLVLLSRRKNSEANNYDFETKKTKYFQSAKTGVANFALHRSSAGVKDWTPCRAGAAAGRSRGQTQIRVASRMTTKVEEPNEEIADLRNRETAFRSGTRQAVVTH